MILLSASFRSLMQLIGVLIIFVFVLIITYFTTKWVGGFQKIQMSKGNLKVLETIRIANGKFLQLVKAGEHPETLLPVEYYCKLPADVKERTVFLTDPMLATGGTAEAAIGFLKDKGVKKIIFLCILAAPEGVKKIQEAHPDVDIYAAAYDTCLNDHGYIVPGLGDAGDRIFGTK